MGKNVFIPNIYSMETKQCQNCKQSFTIEAEDFVFHEKMRVPLSTWCPDCRLMRRLAWRNERALYKRVCDLCKADIIAMYSADVPFPVYCRNCWNSDRWDGLQYGREYDFYKPFFAQFRELRDVVPRMALQVDHSVGCEYANQIAQCKNCYLITSGSHNEDSLYTQRILHSKSVVDSLLVHSSEDSYEVIECRGSSRVFFSQDVADSFDVAFCYDLKGCQSCFMSSNLRNKSYYFYNQLVTKDEYERRMKGVYLHSYTSVQKYREEFRDLLLRSIHRYANVKNGFHVTGQAIANATNCHQVFGVGEVENCHYCLYVNQAKDSMDVNNGCCVMERNYEVCTMGVNASDIRFCVDAWPEVTNASYSDSCRNGSSHLFGCVGLRKRSYCILNRQYSKEEYENLAPRIMEHMNYMPYMDSKGRRYVYGEFFPPELSPFFYSESVAYDYFPLTREEAEGKGFRWKEFETRFYDVTLDPTYVPDSIYEVDESVLNKIIGCVHAASGCLHRCTSAFRVIPQELEFYRRMKLPLPRLCPNCRHFERVRKLTPFKLWKRRCDCGQANDLKLKTENTYRNIVEPFHKRGPCPNGFETSYSPERDEVVYCEECYKSEVV